MTFSFLIPMLIPKLEYQPILGRFPILVSASEQLYFLPSSTTYCPMHCRLFQGVLKEAAAADGHEGDPEELRRLPEAQELAVVEAVHQGQETGPIMHHMESVPPSASNPCCTGLSPPLVL